MTAEHESYLIYEHPWVEFFTAGLRISRLTGQLIANYKDAGQPEFAP